jgi:hypothetical protein
MSKQTVMEIFVNLNNLLPQKSAIFYHGQLSGIEKQATQDKWLNGEAKIMIATSAFGAGIDYPTVSLIIHCEGSYNLLSFCQETGRAGRDGTKSSCFLVVNEQSQPTEKGIHDVLQYARLKDKCRRYALQHYIDGSGVSCIASNSALCDNCQKSEIFTHTINAEYELDADARSALIEIASTKNSVIPIQNIGNQALPSTTNPQIVHQVETHSLKKRRCERSLVDLCSIYESLKKCCPTCLMFDQNTSHTMKSCPRWKFSTCYKCYKEYGCTKTSNCKRLRVFDTCYICLFPLNCGLHPTEIGMCTQKDQIQRVLYVAFDFNQKHYEQIFRVKWQSRDAYKVWLETKEPGNVMFNCHLMLFEIFESKIMK